MKKLQKILAIVLSVAMIMAMAVPGFAATKDTDGATITVSGLKKDDEVYAVQIIDAEYGTNGENFVKYVWAVDFGSAKAGEEVKFDANGSIVELTSENITTFAAGLQDFGSLVTTATTAAADGSYTASFNKEVGSYMVIAKSGANNAVVYNPMVGSVYYDNQDAAQSADPDASGSWTLLGTDLYVKSSEPDITKKIVNCGATDSAEHGDDVAIGDEVQYEVTTSIPSYSAEYAVQSTQYDDDGNLIVDEQGNPKLTDLVYKIEDTMQPSLDLTKGSVYVTVGGKEATAGTDYTLTEKDHGYVVDFDSAYALANAGAKVVVTYKATLNKDATTNMKPNENQVSLAYTHDPKDYGHPKYKYDKTYHYTFEIDGAIFGDKEWTDMSKWSEQPITHEFIKVGKDDIAEIVKEGDTKYYESHATKGSTKKEGLEGAKFALFDENGNKVKVLAADGTWVDEFTTDPHGYLNIRGLDAGKYTLKETFPPKGYALNTTAVPVEITAEYYNTDTQKGLLKSYTIKINDVENTYTATYPTIDLGTNVEVKPKEIIHTYINTPADVIGTSFFKNTPLGGLPATGGVGTTIFTITGVILMVMAAAMMLFVRRRREQ